MSLITQLAMPVISPSKDAYVRFTSVGIDLSVSGEHATDYEKASNDQLRLVMLSNSVTLLVVFHAAHSATRRLPGGENAPDRPHDWTLRLLRHLMDTEEFASAFDRISSTTDSYRQVRLQIEKSATSTTPLCVASHPALDYTTLADELAPAARLTRKPGRYGDFCRRMLSMLNDSFSTDSSAIQALRGLASVSALGSEAFSMVVIPILYRIITKPTFQTALSALIGWNLPSVSVAIILGFAFQVGTNVICTYGVTMAFDRVTALLPSGIQRFFREFYISASFARTAFEFIIRGTPRGLVNFMLSLLLPTANSITGHYHQGATVAGYTSSTAHAALKRVYGQGRTLEQRCDGAKRE